MAIVMTPRELYRAGNKTTARFDVLRPGEVLIQIRQGQDWVIAHSGGASTLEMLAGLSGTWYRLPAGARYDDAKFFLWNDYPNHWAWEPAQDMQLADYVAALAAINQEFIRI
jgi:hypothetical protein